MKTIIIDDEPSAIKVLVDNLKDFKDFEIVGTANNGDIGLKLLRAANPDILFLDVELPDMTGIEFLSLAHSPSFEKCKIVMYTAHSKYMLPAFRNNAFDFLTKPLDPEELAVVAKRLLSEESRPTPLPQSIVERKDNEKLLFYTNTIDFRLAHIRDIGFFQYNHDQRVWEMMLAGNDTPIKLKRNANNETLLNVDTRFVQVNQKYIININYLIEVSDNICRFYPPFDKIDYVKVGRLYRRKLIERFDAL